MLEGVLCYIGILSVVSLDIVHFRLLHAWSKTLADEQLLEVLLLIHLVSDIVWGDVDVGEVVIIGD